MEMPQKYVIVPFKADTERAVLLVKEEICKLRITRDVSICLGTTHGHDVTLERKKRRTRRRDGKGGGMKGGHAVKETGCVESCYSSWKIIAHTDSQDSYY